MWKQKTKTRSRFSLKIDMFVAMRNLVLALLLLALFLVGCGLKETPIATRTPGPGVLLPAPWTATPTTLQTSTRVSTRTPQVWPTVTSTRIPLSRPTRTVTSSKTITPFPMPSTPLSEHGPWLLGSAGGQLVAMNPDGTGLTALNLYSRVWSNKGWVAERVYSDWFQPSDVSIRIVRLPSSEPVRTIRLLSRDLAAQIEESEAWEPFLAPDVYQAVLTDQSIMRWSPDGRYLAFIAAIVGPSADLYVYDTQTDRIIRLTDGPNQAVLMDWSLDGKWIVHMEATNFTSYEGLYAVDFDVKAVWAASVDGSAVKKLYAAQGASEFIMGWRAPSVLVVLRGFGSRPPEDLRSVDVNSGRVLSLYEHEVYRVAADPRTGAVAYIAIPTEEGPEASGLYLLRTGEVSPIKIDVGEWVIPEEVVWFPETGLFYTQLGREIVVFDSSGKILRSFEERLLPVPSPDGRWLAFARPDSDGVQPGLFLYNSGGEFVRELSHQKVSGVIWSSDSTGIFFNERIPMGDGFAPRLLYASMPEGEPSVVHPNPGASFFAWVEP